MERVLAPRRKNLLNGVQGRVLELGSGTGVNLPYLPPVLDWIGIDPNPYMTSRLSQRFADRKVIEGIAEKIPFPDSSFDVCIATLVLCSVADLSRSLAEIRRVLTPGGKFLFLEHVIAPPSTLVRVSQNLVYWPWRGICEGCRTNRDSLAAIQLQFENVDAENYWIPWWVAPPWVRYQVVGTAK
jgi:ubiquinone/menaquinone biosynthesis C-methylase UbiE